MTYSPWWLRHTGQAPHCYSGIFIALGIYPEEPLDLNPDRILDLDPEWHAINDDRQDNGDDHQDDDDHKGDNHHDGDGGGDPSTDTSCPGWDPSRDSSVCIT